MQVLFTAEKNAHRSYFVLRYIQQNPGSTLQSLNSQLNLPSKDIYLSLSMLYRYGYVSRWGDLGFYYYSVSELGHKWLHDNGKTHLSSERQVSLLKHQKQALQLEQRGLWHRAAYQWLLVFDLSVTDEARALVANHRDRCIKSAKLKALTTCIMNTDAVAK